MKPLFLLCLLSFSSLMAQDLHKWNANVGGGVSFGLGDAGDRVNTGYNFGAGAGLNISKRLGFEVDYIFNNFNLSDKALQAAAAPNGYAHLWGFSANPVYRFSGSGKLGGYVLGGYGVFTRTVNLTRPGVVPGVICDPWTFLCYTGPVYADLIYRSNSTTKGGWDIGGGITYRLGESGAKFFAEIRYYDVLTNDIRGTFLPLTFGFRW
jgi:opacity protein-like surface antigen